MSDEKQQLPTYWVVTTFAEWAWDLYARDMVLSFHKFWPADFGLYIKIETENKLLFSNKIKTELSDDKNRLIIINADDYKPHLDFLAKHKETKQNYRYQFCRFSHKPCAIKVASQDIAELLKANGHEGQWRLTWIDADTIFNEPILDTDIDLASPEYKKCVSYLGRKDWDHLEGGFIYFVMPDAQPIIDELWNYWENESIFNQAEWHDSYLLQTLLTDENSTNLTKDKPGINIWPHFSIGAKSIHNKGVEKFKPLQQAPSNGIRFTTVPPIETNVIMSNIRANEKLFVNWLLPATNPNEKTAVIAAAGNSFIGTETFGDNPIFACKSSMERLLSNGQEPFACVLLDPRPHVYEFVKNPSKKTIYFVASMVDPKVTKSLLEDGCHVVGYHAPNTNEEQEIMQDRQLSIIASGSSASIRSIWLAKHLGFKKFHLVGYDLCYDTEPNLKEVDGKGNPLNYALDLTAKHYYLDERKRTFWTQGQWAAQMQELERMAKAGFEFTADGYGYAKWYFDYLQASKVAELRKNGYTDTPKLDELVKQWKKS